MMNIFDIGKVFDYLEAAYGAILYKDTNKENVLMLWKDTFKDDDPIEVANAVKECVMTSQFPPKVSEVRLRIAKKRIGPQMTGLEAFNEIKKALNIIRDDKKSYKNAFNNLPPLVRKTAVSASQLLDWSKMDPLDFDTYVMSFIVRDFEKNAKLEIERAALSKEMQAALPNPIIYPEPEALPEPYTGKTVAEKKEEEIYHRTPEEVTEKNQKYKDRKLQFVSNLDKGIEEINQN